MVFFSASDVLKDFPSTIKLSYDKISHKKVQHFDFAMAIPEGNKCFAWFTTHENKNVCFLMEVEEGVQEFRSIKIMNACFHSELSYGTILYGTTFEFKKNLVFSIEDIYYYKGKNVSRNKYRDKLNLFIDLFNKDIRQISYNNQFLVFGLPLMNENFHELIREMSALEYKLSYIQYGFYENNRLGEKNKYMKPSTSRSSTTTTTSSTGTKGVKVFKIKADAQNDIYNLYFFNDEYYDVAYIEGYTMSVMMNRLFRKIKENYNLDALEESDSEDEFENNEIDKFVDLDQTINMVCTYNNKFRKWQPLRIANKNEPVCNNI